MLHILRHRYTNLLPRASNDEVLIEKSPQVHSGLVYCRLVSNNLFQYIGGAGSPEAMVERAWAMKIINPKLKIIIVTCDPIRQMYSQFRMQQRRAAEFQTKGLPMKKCEACLKKDMKSVSDKIAVLDLFRF